MQHFVVQVANMLHLHYADTICNEMESSAKARGTGIAKRTPEYIRQKMLEGKAVIASTKNGDWAGFCYIETWSHGNYVANSGLIVAPEFRKSGLATDIKKKIFELSKTNYPDAKIFGLTTGLAVMKINSDLGYEPVTYSELTQDEAFWKGCQSCVNFEILKSKERKNCLCTAMLYNPEEKNKSKWFDFVSKQKVMERLLRMKQTNFLKKLIIKKRRDFKLIPMKNNNVILAFSGGLDTTYCALYLKNELKLNVHAVTVEYGGFTEQEKQKLEQHAENLGVTSFKIINAKQSYYDKIIKYLVFGNVLKNNTYPLSVSAERIIQALAIADYAKLLGAEAIAHGSTGAGNDQVRFDMAFQILLPDAKIITPIRDLKLSRQAEIEYLKKNGVEMNFEKALYSVNKGIWGNSVGGKETLTSHLSLPENAWPTPISKIESEKIKLHFEKGELKQINDIEYPSSVDAIEVLNSLASPFGIGRDIHVGDTIIGIKGRVGFEAAASLIIIKAHHALEKHVLTKWQLYWKDQLALWYGNWLHEGQYLDPSMRDIEAFFESTQQNVTGEVFVTLMPFRFAIDGITSPHDLMNEQFGSYGEMNKSFTGEDVKGFTKIFGNQTAIYYKVNELQNNLILNSND